jgi:catechol 2,3-dioxygenase-like lactoylglutathione lyase family enzyme
MLRNLMYVTVYVSDLDRALVFYTENLGLEKRVDASGPYGRFLTVAPGDESVEILLWPGNPGRGAAADAAEPGIVPGPIFIEAEDLAKEFEVLRSRGVTFVEDEPVPYEFGVRLTALDPDGNRIELRQRPPRRSSDRCPTRSKFARPPGPSCCGYPIPGRTVAASRRTRSGSRMPSIWTIRPSTTVNAMTENGRPYWTASSASVSEPSIR